MPMVTSIGNNAFQQCTAIRSINFPLVDTIGGSAFSGCKYLDNVKIPIITKLNNREFQDCQSLTKIDLPKVTTIGSYAFYGCRRLVAVILRSETVCANTATTTLGNCYHFIGTNAPENPGGAKDGYFYVPRALVDSYKAATNWSTYAAQFRALEDYTVDGTITGELDETKI